MSIAGGLAGCTSDDQWAGGPVTPSPVPITFNPYALPRGDTVPTGIVVEGLELVLYLWGSNQAGPALDYAWRNVESGTVGDHTAFPGQYVVAKTGAGAFFDLGQMSFNDSDLLIEFGAVRAVVGRITSSSDGDVTEARFATWSEDASVTIFWLKRHGARIPDNVEVEPGRTEPLDEDRTR